MVLLYVFRMEVNTMNQTPYVHFHILVCPGDKTGAKSSKIVEAVGVGCNIFIFHGKVLEFLFYILYFVSEIVLIDQE